MIENPFLRAIYASARRELERARENEDDALRFAMDQYRGGPIGREARRLYVLHNERRSHHLAEALRFRRNAKRFRARLEQLDGAA